MVNISKTIIFDLRTSGAQHIFYIPWPGAIAQTFPPAIEDLSFRNVQKDFEKAGIHMQTRNRAAGRDFGLEASSVKPTPRSKTTVQIQLAILHFFFEFIVTFIHIFFVLS